MFRAILDSIDFWKKQLGKDGYYKFVGNNLFIEVNLIEASIMIFNEETLEKDLKDYK